MHKRKFFAVSAAVLFFVSTATNFIRHVSAEEESITLPGAFMVLSLDTWTNRKLRMSGLGLSNMVIYGGSESGNVYNLSMSSATAQPVSIYGGYYDGILSNEIENITGNEINLFGDSAGWLVYDDPNKLTGNYAKTNIFTTDGSNLTVNLIAGHSGLGEVSGNRINLLGGATIGIISLAETKTGTKNISSRLHDNEMNIYNSPNLILAKLYGATVFDDATKTSSPVFGTNNTLNIYDTQDISVSELAAFNNYNFYLPYEIKNKDIVINVTGSRETDISGSKIYAVVPQREDIQITDTFTLIQNYSGIPDSSETNYRGVNADTFTTEWRNASAITDIIVGKSDDNHVIVSFKGKRLTRVATLIAEPRAVRTNSFFTGDPPSFNSNLPFEGAMSLGNDVSAGAQVFTPFFAVNHGSMRYKTGSHVDSRQTNLVVGMSFKKETPARTTLIAPMFEYGRGNYDSYLDGGEHGQGHNRYIGGGLVFRNKFGDGKYYEGSIRAGRAKTDFESTDFTIGDRRIYEAYKSNAHYIGAHFGVGRELQQNENDSLLYYGKFIYSHTGADDVQLTTGEHYHFSPVNSEVIKIGIRDAKILNKKSKIYAGLSLEYEFSGKAYAEHEGLKTDTPAMKGFTGNLEFGWIYKPQANDKWSIDLGGVGSIGKKRGLTGRLGINWLF